MAIRALGCTAVFVLSLIVSVAFAQTATFVEYDTDLLPPSFHRERRERVMEKIGDDAIAVFSSAPLRMRNGDVEYQYRQDDNFYYLTGFAEPNALLLLLPKGISVPSMADSTKRVQVREILFVQSRDPFRERWDGRRYGPEGAVELRGVEYATTNDRFRTIFSMAMVSGIRQLYVPSFRSDLSGEIRSLLAPVQSFIDQMAARNSKVELRDPTAMVHEMRIVKSPEEIRLLRKATEISVAAHREAIASCEPGMFEYELQALYEYVFRRMGAEYPGYPCIVGAGENSVILHYNAVRRRIGDGDLVLADCAAEYHGYSSDITRTFPANGRFSPQQRSIYEIVLAAQNAAIAMMKPGVAWSLVQAKASEVLENGLIALGLLRERNPRELRRFTLHGLGHPVGLNVHDVGDAILRPGMVYTVEPGIYIPEGMEGVDPSYYNIGVRIEDVVLITEKGNELLSGAAPREVEEIEALMRKRGIGNQPLQ